MNYELSQEEHRMKTKTLSSLMLLLIGLGIGLLTPACTGLNNESSQATVPVANITSPQNGSTLTQGQELLVTFNSADVNGVAQIELSIDSQPVMVEKVEPPVNSYTASYRWLPDQVGTHLIEFRAFNVDGTASPASQISVTVVGVAGTAEATATIAPADTPTIAIADIPTSPPPPPSPTPEPTATETVAAASQSQAIVTLLTNLNVRLGPSTDYPVIGRMGQGETARITGRNELSTWWEIEFTSDSGNRGWVSASSQYTSAANTEGVPIVQAPAFTAPSPTPIPPSPTPVTLKPTIYTFTADRYTIAKGESVTLNWDLANAQEAYLRYNDEEEGVVAPGRKTVSPEEDTKYTLVARNQAGETTAELTIKVGGATATPVPVLRDGEIRVANGQSIDFDQGLIVSGPGGGADFLWDGQRRQFFPQNGAAGALLGGSYDNIDLDDCQDVEYNQPISGVDGSGQVTGCFITNEGRYGKFFVSEWDLAANLTIEWLTWDVKR
jgi:hypothetical protein